MKQAIIVLAGVPGAWKTTLGIAISRALGIARLDKDTLKAPLLAAGIAEEVAAPTAYELFFDVARDLVVVQGLSVILDSPTIYPRILASAHAIAGEVGAPVKIIACRVEFETRQARMAARPRKLSQLAADATPDITAAEWFAHLPPDTLWLDTAQPLARLLTIALPYITAITSE